MPERELRQLIARALLEREQGGERVVQVGEHLGLGFFRSDVQDAAQHVVIDLEAVAIERERGAINTLLIEQAGQVRNVAAEVGMVLALAFGDDRDRFRNCSPASDIRASPA